MQVIYERDGTVRHPDTKRVIGGWRKVPDPRARPGAQQHVFKVWEVGREEETARNFYPRYYANQMFRDDHDKLMDAKFKYVQDDIHTRRGLFIRKDTPGYYTILRDKDVLGMGDIDEVLEIAQLEDDPLYGIDFLKMSGLDLVRLIDEKGQEDTYKRLKYLFPHEAYEETHYLAESDGRFVGVLSVQPNPHDEEVLWVKHVVVDPEFQGRKIASELVKFAFTDLAEEPGPVYTVRLSSFTDEGREKIRRVFEREAWRLGRKTMEMSPHDLERDESLDF